MLVIASTKIGFADFAASSAGARDWTVEAGHTALVGDLTSVQVFGEYKVGEDKKPDLRIIF